MPGLITPLLERMRDVYIEHFADHEGVKRLVNDVVDDETDFEHLLTFLEDTPSRPYRDLAERLETVFSVVLRAALERASEHIEHADGHENLYAALVDMHQVKESGEALAGFLTLNYDPFLEHAIENVLGQGVDYGVDVHGAVESGNRVRVLKLHGSFTWKHSWPLTVTSGIEAGHWIAPGIRKAKGDYPFNLIWGAARELLDCDVLRIIGCNLSSNDWDLVSLLFSTMYGRETARPYEVEVIAGPGTASRIAKALPYLKVRNLLELEGIGPVLITELLSRGPAEYSSLSDPEREAVFENAKTITNPFERWLRVKGELMIQNLDTIETQAGCFEQFVAAPP